MLDRCQGPLCEVHYGCNHFVGVVRGFGETLSTCVL